MDSHSSPRLRPDFTSMDSTKNNQRSTSSRENSLEKDAIDDGIWSSILIHVQKSSANKLPSNKSILVLGENGCGKTSLIAKMQGNDDPRKGSGLEFHHLLVRDDYRDEFTRLGAWILDGDPSYSKLLKFALNEKNFQDTIVLITIGMNQPWLMMDSLEKWVKILSDHIKQLSLPPEVLHKGKHNVARRFLEYVSPGDEIESLAAGGIGTSSAGQGMSTSSSGRMSQSFEASKLLNGEGGDELPELDIPEGVLTENLGIEIVVVVTLTDTMNSLEKDLDYREEHFDFIQQAIRKCCLKYGASLFYTSAKASKNCDLLYKYIVNRIYGLPFKTPALVVEKDAVFIPSGWDNEKKIAILYDNIQSFSPDDDFNEIILKPSQRKAAQKEMEAVADDDQTFLTKMQGQLSQVSGNAVAGPGGSSGVGSGINSSLTPNRAQLSSSDLRMSPAVSGSKQGDPRRSLGTPQLDAKGSPGNEGVLQNFFNSLLNRKSTGISPAGGVAGSPRAPNINSEKTRHEVAAELDRMTSGTSLTPKSHLLTNKTNSNSHLLDNSLIEETNSSNNLHSSDSNGNTAEANQNEP